MGKSEIRNRLMTDGVWEKKEPPKEVRTGEHAFGGNKTTAKPFQLSSEAKAMLDQALG